MKILRFNNLKFECGSYPRTGVLLGRDTIADLRVGYARYLAMNRKDIVGRARAATSAPLDTLSMTAVARPELAALRIEPNIVSLISVGKPAWTALEATAAYLSELFESDPTARGPMGEPLFMPFADCKLHAPIRPGKIVTIRSSPGSDQPPLWIKANNTIKSPFRNIVMPAGIKQLQCETKLAVVIGQRGFHVPEDKAYDIVFGYMLANDVSVRNDPNRDMYNTFLPAGPGVVTKDEVKNPMNLRIRAQVNNKLGRDTNTKDMPLSIVELISYVSSIMRLEPGDLLLTGTPANNPNSVALPLQLGDVLDSEIEGVAKLNNKVGDDASK